MKNTLLAILFFTSILYSSAQDITGVVTTNVNVRWEPSTSSGVIKVFDKGKEVLILDTKGKWSFIKDPINNKKGWVSSKFIQTNVGYITQNANVRNNPGGKILKQINKGKKVIVLKEKGKWIFIKDVSNNKKGWVHQSLLSFNKVSNANSSSSSTSSSSSANSSHNSNTNSSSNTSSISIIEKRMRKMGLYEKWKQFYKNLPSRFIISNINTFINTVESYMGVPYKYGGNSRSGTDCSGLVFIGLKSVGYDGSRLNAESVAKLGRFIGNKTYLKRGDLVFFKTSSRLVSHVGVYSGNGKFIHAPSSGGKVSTANVDDPYYWGDRFLFGVRLTKD